MAGGATLTNAGTVLSDPAITPAARQINGNLVNQGTVTINQSVGIDHLNNQAAGTVALSQNQSLSVTSDSLEQRRDRSRSRPARRSTPPSSTPR